MADENTTPKSSADARQGAPAGPRSKKRAAPTIDLTATEMPPSSDAPPAPEQEPAAAASEPPGGHAEDAPAATPAAPPGGRIGAAVLGGVAGGAIATLALLALWLTGLVPARYPAATDSGAQIAALQAQIQELQNRPAAAPDAKLIDALTRRVSAMEDAVSKLPAGNGGVAERLVAADTALKSLGVAIAALNRRVDEIAATVSATRERSDAATKAVTEFGAQVQELAKSDSTGISPAALDALQKRIAALEQSATGLREDIAKASAADTAARLAMSAAALRDAALAGAPFSAELAQAQALGASGNELAPLVPFAAAGVPTATALAHELRALLPAMRKLAGPQAAQGGFLERLQANASKLVSIRPVNAPPGDDASAVLARLDAETAKADIDSALGDLGKLTDAVRAPAQDWIAKAKARQAARAAARQFAADTARALAPKAGTP
jgi:hypothetical protein